jgi:hypothetical protein
MQPAVDLCIEAKVASQNDKAKLELIKDKVYKVGHSKRDSCVHATTSNSAA